MIIAPPPIRDTVDGKVMITTPTWVLWLRKLANIFGTPPDYSEFESDGTYLAHGNATVWNDIVLPTSNLKPGNTAPVWTNIVGGIYGWVFADGVIDELHGCSEVLHDYMEGTDIYPHAHWSPTTTNTGVCRFGLEYAWRNIGEDGMTTTIIYAEQASSGTIGLHQYAAFPAISGTGKKMGSNFCMRFFRDGTHVDDTFTGGAFVPTVGFHYQCDTLGSRQQMVK